MGHDSKCARKDGSNVTGPGSYVQDGDAVGDSIWQRELGGDRVDVQGSDGVPPSGGATDHRYDGETWGSRRIGLTISRGGDGSCGAPPNWGVHKEAAYNHR